MTSLVFVHGFMGGSAQWSEQVNYFNRFYNVITPDLPGFGKNNHMTAPDKIADYADYVLEYLTGLGIDTFHLVGHSMGGMIVQEMMAIAPSRIHKFVLYGTSAAGSLPQRFETFDVSRNRARTDGPLLTAKRISATWFLQKQKAAEYPGCTAIAEKASLQAICAGLDAMEPWSALANLANIKSPTLVLWGDKDRTYSWPQIQQLWDSIPNASLAVVPDCAHAVHLEKPEIFNALLADFLSQ